MKKTPTDSAKIKRELEALDRKPDAEIDFSEIPFLDVR